MPKKTFTPEQIVTKLRQIEVAVAHDKTTPQACKEAEVSEQSYYRWRKEYGGLALTRLRGHLPRGGYDVPHGQDRGTPGAAQVHGCF